MKAWLFQDARQKQKLGEDKCPWSVGWLDPDGRRRSKRVGSESLAKKFQRKKEGELANGLVALRRRVRWSEFRKQMETDVLATKAPNTREQYKRAFNQFELAVSPVYIDAITTATVDRFIRKRIGGGGIEPGTVNKELRHLKAALRKAHRWGYLPLMPQVEMLREIERDPEFVDDATFAKLYQACDQMTRPAAKHFEPVEWWQALLTFAYLTGWRIGQILEIRREDLDFASGMVFVEGSKTKGRRDARVQLPSVVLDHVKRIIGFEPLVFTWPHHERTLWLDFAKLKAAAEVEFTGAFHRFRFGFANANVDRLPEDLLQQLMLHRDRKTTRHYVNATERMRRSQTSNLVHVPEVLKRKAN